MLLSVSVSVLVACYRLEAPQKLALPNWHESSPCLVQYPLLLQKMIKAGNVPDELLVEPYNLTPSRINTSGCGGQNCFLHCSKTSSYPCDVCEVTPRSQYDNLSAHAIVKAAAAAYMKNQHGDMIWARNTCINCFDLFYAAKGQQHGDCCNGLLCSTWKRAALNARGGIVDNPDVMLALPAPPPPGLPGSARDPPAPAALDTLVLLNRIDELEARVVALEKAIAANCGFQ
jgi:hypothetical protein